MMKGYATGDPYLAFAKQARLAPPEATKASHTAVRERCKVVVLGVNYGMGPEALAISLGVTPAEARELLRLHRETYRRFWSWSDDIVTSALLRNEMQTVFGWRRQIGPGVNARSLMNFPMQANGAEMMRIAAIAATEAGIEVCAPVHDRGPAGAARGRRHAHAGVDDRGRQGGHGRLSGAHRRRGGALAGPLHRRARSGAVGPPSCRAIKGMRHDFGSSEPSHRRDTNYRSDETPPSHGRDTGSSYLCLVLCFFLNMAWNHPSRFARRMSQKPRPRSKPSGDHASDPVSGSSRALSPWKCCREPPDCPARLSRSTSFFATNVISRVGQP
jgi:DNA polymerase family A